MLEDCKAMEWKGGKKENVIMFSCSNVSGMGTKAASVADEAMGGLHALIESQADVLTMSKVEREIKMRNKEGGRRAIVVWGEPQQREWTGKRGAKVSAGLALVEKEKTFEC